MGIDKPDVRLVIHHSLPNPLKAITRKPAERGGMAAGTLCAAIFYADKFKQDFLSTTSPI